MTERSQRPRIVKCPTCGKDVPWVAASRWRPFCSERCRQIDFGAWASEAYRVPDEREQDAEGGENPPTPL